MPTRHALLLRCPTLLALLLLSGPTAAVLAEEEEDARADDSSILVRTADLRLVIGAGPGIRKATFTNASTLSGSPTSISQETYTAHMGPWLESDLMFRSGRRSGFGFIYGPGVFYSWTRGENDGAYIAERRKVTSYGVLVSAGPTFQWEALRLELLPLLGAGVADGQDEEVGSGIDAIDKSGHGFYFVYGARLGVYGDFEDGDIGLQLGYQAFRAQMQFPAYASTALNRDASTDTLTGSGAFIAGAFAIKW